MLYSVARAALAVAVSIAVAGPVYAQSNQANDNARKPKKANQVPDSGLDQPDADQPAPFERVVETVPVTVRIDGTIVAELDESFDEALTVSLAADGTLTFAHQTAVGAAQVLPSRPLPSLFPVPDEKE